LHLEGDRVVTARPKKRTRLARPMYPNRGMMAPTWSLAHLTHSVGPPVRPTQLWRPVFLRNPTPHLAHLILFLGRLMHPIPHPAHQVPYLVRPKHRTRSLCRPTNQMRREPSVPQQLRFHENVAQVLNSIGELTHCGWQFVHRAKRPALVAWEPLGLQIVARKSLAPPQARPSLRIPRAPEPHPAPQPELPHSTRRVGYQTYRRRRSERPRRAQVLRSDALSRWDK
jgi:hypothetical protein